MMLSSDDVVNQKCFQAVLVLSGAVHRCVPEMLYPVLASILQISSIAGLVYSSNLLLVCSHLYLLPLMSGSSSKSCAAVHVVWMNSIERFKLLAHSSTSKPQRYSL